MCVYVREGVRISCVTIGYADARIDEEFLNTITLIENFN